MTAHGEDARVFAHPTITGLASSLRLVAIVETAMVAPLLALLDELFDRDGASASPNVILLGAIGLLAFGATRWLR
ncbi:MAG: hypothetical protein R2845_01685 [Thermomicrobiales bacterium]